MKVIGLTGKACSGKNYIAKEFEKRNFYVIDVDKLGHKALIESKDKIVKTFGDIVDESGEIDRKKLGNIVFSSKEQLKKLESIVHPKVKEYCISLIAEDKKTNDRNIILNAALLDRGNLTELCSQFIFVKASFLTRFRRCVKRDNRNFRWFLKRDIAQKDIKITKEMRQKGVYCMINNDGNVKIYRQVSTYCDILNISNC